MRTQFSKHKHKQMQKTQTQTQTRRGSKALNPKNLCRVGQGRGERKHQQKHTTHTNTPKREKKKIRRGN